MTTRIAYLAIAALLTAACSRQPATPHAADSGPLGMPWSVQADDWVQKKAALQALGEQFDSSSALYEKLKADAHGGKPLTWAQLGGPAYDWSGTYTRSKGGLQFDPDLGPAAGPASAQLTSEGQKVVDAKAAHLKSTGGEYDPISDCRPPGTPRWFTEPFLHEFMIAPHQTLLINEMVNDVRRVYTDGREHTAEDDAYASWNGDTVGFWDGDILVTHTKYLMSGQYQRGVQPDYSDRVTTVERWHKVDPKTLQVDLWVFDPVNLAKPWYVRQSYTQLTNDDHLLRIRYWDCRENSNNAIIVTENGNSQFPDLNFVDNDAAVSSDADVKKHAQEKAAH
ncbi:MAG: hypothetical protein ABI640_10345 [Gammaproteobacteria bacterium]